ncbi:hypothetical protein [Achromobacter sp. Marseille-Q4962]|uniref:hypothetical protein n=1 Tax=Achromobacter sp. Marseille-Q4962 TaxID=2942202 RepID=UPI002073D938|nr:hypothetical protein [Achromobacter sp. Marseille-Q4962]
MALLGVAKDPVLLPAGFLVRGARAVPGSMTGMESGAVKFRIALTMSAVPSRALSLLPAEVSLV